MSRSNSENDQMPNVIDEKHEAWEKEVCTISPQQAWRCTVRML
jgi:hypothetical protein